MVRGNAAVAAPVQATACCWIGFSVCGTGIGCSVTVWRGCELTQHTRSRCLCVRVRCCCYDAMQGAKDKAVGALLLAASAAIFVYYTAWVLVVVSGGALVLGHDTA